MAESSNQAAASVETRQEYEKSPADFTRHWLQAIDLASTEEEDWRKDGEATLERYRKSAPKSFNILYANTQTTIPALYNSEPAPDVRARFGGDDEVRENVADLIERALSIQAEMYGFDGCMKAAVMDRQLPGRGVTRLRVVIGENGSKHIECEPVIWDDFRRGPAKTWKDVPWIAYRYKRTREELIKINPKIGADVKLDVVLADAPKKDNGNADDLPDMFKRATTWEVWDKLKRKVYIFAESYTDGPLQNIDDPYGLVGFLPSPEPLYQVPQTSSLVPVCEFQIWKPLADEVDDLTRRIAGIVKVIKLRGLYSGAFSGLMSKLKDLDDGELAAADDPARAMGQEGLDKAVWVWPVDMAITVVQGLYEAREQAKTHLYELTGVADILRGSTQPSETATAQQIKAQWGSLRLQEAQRDVQRYARDLYRMMADLMIYSMDPAELQAMTGVSLAPEVPQDAPIDQLQKAQQAEQQALSLLKSDIGRQFAIEIETDSTIKADLSRAQQNVAGFVTGLGTFMDAAGPAVQGGFMPPEVAVQYIAAFSRNFKLGREADEATDAWLQFLQQKAQQPQQPQQDPKVQAEQIKAEAAAQKAQADVQMVQVKAQAEQQKTQLDMRAKEAEFQMRMQELEAELQALQAEHGLRMREQAQNAAMQERQHQLQAEDQQRAQEAAEHGHGLKMEVMDAQAKAKQQAAQRPNGGAA